MPAAVAAAALGALVHTGYTLLLAYGRQKQCLVADAWKLAATLLALALFLPGGARTYLQALCGMHVVSFGLVATMLWRGRGVTAGAIAQAIGPPAAAAALASGIALLLGGPSLVAQGTMFGVVYVLTLRVLFARPLAELVRYLPQSARLSRWLRLSAGAAST